MTTEITMLGNAGIINMVNNNVNMYGFVLVLVEKMIIKELTSLSIMELF